MEIHPPRHVGSMKEFFKELLTITIGILIALSFEGMLEWKHHRELAREARTNILSEMRDNRRELAKEEQELARMQQEAQQLVAAVHRLEGNRKSPPEQLQLTWTLAELHSTSWDAATRAGAIAYMPYSEVQRYTVVYDLQHSFTELEQRAFGNALDVEGLATLTQRKQETLSAAELSDAEHRIGTALASINAMQSIAQPLRESYDKTGAAISER
jgi:hypothetical protein